MRAIFKCCLLAGVSFVFNGAAYAQAPAATAAPQANEADQLGEIIVTAQRRAERLQDVPIAVTSISPSQAAAFGVSAGPSLANMVPGFEFTRQGSTVTPFLRGIGSSGSFAGNEPSIATFVDGVYVPTGGATVFDFNNIQSIEVLKGPQGTLFGRNATGGVVQVQTRDPSYETTGDVDIGYANYDTISAHAYFSTGLTDNVAFNVAAYGINQRDGWGENVVTGRDIFRHKSYGVRGKLLFDISDATSVLLLASYSYVRSEQGIAYRVVPGVFGRGGYSPEALGAGFYDGATNTEGRYYSKYANGSVKITHDFGNATLVSITGYGHFRNPSTFDVDASPTQFFQNVKNYDREKTFTQELQLLSPNDSNVSWILGAYYLYDKADITGQFQIAVPGASTNMRTWQRTNSFSGFAQASTDILPRLNMTLGVRYTSDRRKAGGQADNGLPWATPPVAPTVFSFPADESETFSAVTGRFALNYKVSQDVNVYAAYNRGFKSGVFNLPALVPTSTRIGPAVFPEELNAYSVGLKSEFFNRRARLNVEAFYYDYTNIQVSTVQPTGGSFITNGGAATIKGFDVDLTVRPVTGLTISGSLSYAHGRYDEFDNGPTFFPQPPNAPIPIPAGCAFTTYPTAPGPVAQRACSLAGNKTVNTVPLSTNLNILYELPTAIGEITFAGNWAHRGGQYFQADNNPFTRQPKVDLFDASISWKSNNEALGIQLWARNITKEKYYSYVTETTSAYAKYSPAAPRTYGITLSSSF